MADQTLLSGPQRFPERWRDNGDSTYQRVGATVLIDPATGGATSPLPATTTTDRSLSASTTATNAMAANAARRGWKVKNDSAIDVYIRFTGTASAVAGGGNIKIAAGAYIASEPSYVETGAMSIIAASGTPAITIYEFT